ncbi:olfactory receptor 11A1-like [Perca fluviatilis]|uniref:olfactory receptor 11A1-like n=1 Tax=Perca fluviatilis TaxID=8168 RepID=UPI0019662891|nr:olfactory receptor 11A1-like [Perca fluviatilis]
MDSELNITYITLGGHVEVDKYRYLYFLMMFTVYFLIICSNSTIVYLIWVHQNLHKPMYIFIAALLLNSLLISTAIYPKLLIDLSEKQLISYSACLFQCFLYYSLNGSEFLLLAAMSYDRYVSICKPLQYHTIMKKTTVRIFLGFAWFVPACQVALPVSLSANTKLCNFTLKAIFCNNSIYKLHCVSSRALTVYSGIFFFNVTLLPVLFIIFTYTKIFIVTYQSRREVRMKAAQTCLPHLLVLISFSFLFTYDVVIVKLELELPKTIHFIMTLQVILYHPLFNPIIYGLKMKEIYNHIRRLFCQRKLHQHINK